MVNTKWPPMGSGYEGEPDRTFARSSSTSTDRRTWLIVEAYQRPLFAVGTSSSFRTAAMALSDFPAARSSAIRNRTASGRSGA